MAIIDTKEDKWYRKTIAAFRKNWASAVSRAETYDAWCDGIAAITGLSKAQVAASLPASEFKKFQANPSAYVEVAIRKIELAHGRRKWATNYKRAFGG